MIGLSPHPKPDFLSDEKVAKLTAEFKRSGKSVWNHIAIKEALLKSSNNKCAYCECILTIESNYLEIEHFHDKKNHPDKVVSWSNLLPSCKKCNGSKGAHDVINEPIINPYLDNPQDHLYMRLYRMRGKTEKGNTTIDVTGLNHSSRLVSRRFEIGEKISELVDNAWERYERYLGTNNTRTKNRLLSLIEKLLEECQPEAMLSASTSTTLLSDSKFIELVGVLKTNNLWTEELEKLYIQATEISLEIEHA